MDTIGLTQGKLRVLDITLVCFKFGIHFHQLTEKCCILYFMVGLYILNRK